MDRIDALRLFSAVAELESFTRAAERLGLTPGAASKQIAALEERMQARLLERTTRSVRLTDAGRALLDRVRPWLMEYDAIETGLAAEQAAAAGVLRVSAPVDFGAHKLIAPVTAFMTRWPGVEVRLEMTDRMVDLVDEGYDLGVRLGHLNDSSLIARRLAAAPMSLLAGSAYLEAAGAPAHPSDLSRHDCIIDRNRPAPMLWRFQRGNEQAEAKVSGRLTLNGAKAAVCAAASGAGIACTPEWAAREAIDAGDVVEIMKDWTPEGRDLWAVFPSNRYLAQRVRLFVDHLAVWFKDGLCARETA
ncbi:LysR family transcriptional regulator [Alkalicaulis satelles]|uniref:LysR family transcriptional regulator n=1 Tax=Alkalicaulis satelles TaxID=2609175 RepID=A0A5M6ZF02_9PROT|nr:LysR family transcriptional regulator [Alkalicaulis satelles]KAA5801678.1 LysR family transcriptional regulator [Alkalicaulis satelles]